MGTSSASAELIDTGETKEREATVKLRVRHPRYAHSTPTTWLASLMVIFLLGSTPAFHALAAETEAPEAETAQETETAKESDQPEKSSETAEEAKSPQDSKSGPTEQSDQESQEDPPANKESEKQETESKDSAPEKSEADASEGKPMKQDESTTAEQQESKDTAPEAQETKTETTETETKESAATSVEPEPTMEIEPEQPAEKKPEPLKETPKETDKEKCIIGSTATLLEKQSGLKFKARIDTGAKSCSLHVEKIEIQDESTKEDIAERMTENIGKVITFVVKNGDGKTHILKRKIASYVIIKTSDKAEGKRRYKVPLTFLWKNMEKEVLVTLNNRKHMEYPLLIGRNFLRGDFLVDVEMNSDD